MNLFIFHHGLEFGAQRFIRLFHQPLKFTFFSFNISALYVEYRYILRCVASIKLIAKFFRALFISLIALVSLSLDVVKLGSRCLQSEKRRVSWQADGFHCCVTGTDHGTLSSENPDRVTKRNKKLCATLTSALYM